MCPKNGNQEGNKPEMNEKNENKNEKINALIMEIRKQISLK